MQQAEDHTITVDIEQTAGRLTRLETRLTEQEAVIDDLNKTITEQWRLIDRLSRQVAALREQVETAGERGDPRMPEPPPPHY